MSADLHGPVLGRRRLSVALRHARDQTGWTQEQVAAAMDWSLSKLIRIEKGTVGISTSDLRSLLSHYGIGDSERVNALVRLAKSSRERPWWAPYREHLPSADHHRRGVDHVFGVLGARCVDVSALALARRREGHEQEDDRDDQKIDEADEVERSVRPSARSAGHAVPDGPERNIVQEALAGGVNDMGVGIAVR